MAVHVDDIVITGDDAEKSKCLQENLGRALGKDHFGIS
jgi:hypothetical protein